MKQSSRERIRACEDLVRKGDLNGVRRQLSVLRKHELQRGDLVTVAELSRRVGLYDLGLKFLRPVMQPSSRRHLKPSDQEKAIYAALLIKVGAIEEALGYLARPNPEVPETLLFRGYAHVAQWDYTSAEPFLRAYSELGSVTEYQRTTALVNLASALVFNERFDQVEALLRNLENTTRANGWTLLLGGVQEILARSAMGQKKWDEARARLDEAERQYRSESNVLLFTRKWKTLLPLVREAATKADIENVVALRSGAHHAKHWETVRDCDYYLALAKRDQDLFSRVYFGTPFMRFRERMLRNNCGLVAPEKYFWECGGSGGRAFDIERGQELNGSATLKPGQKLHLFAKALVQDFYKPSLLGNIHSKIFPGVHFDPAHSSRRVSDLIRRFRQWLIENEIPLEVKVHDGAFLLEATGPIRLALENQDSKRVSPGEVGLNAQLSALREAVNETEFSSQAAAGHLNISRRAANLILARAVEERVLVRVGQGPLTRYRFGDQEKR